MARKATKNDGRAGAFDPAAVKIQTLDNPVGGKFAVLAFDDFARLQALAIEAAEDAEDIAAGTAALARIGSGEFETIPLDVYQRMRRENRIKVLREYRGLTQRGLAEAAGTDAMYVSQLETGRRHAGLRVLRRIAGTLKVPLDLVQPGEKAEPKPASAKRLRTARAAPPRQR